MKVGTEDGKLRFATYSEARRVRQRLMAAAVSPAGGRSRRVTADPEADPDSDADSDPELALRSGAGAGAGPPLPTRCAGSVGAAEPRAPKGGAESGRAEMAAGIAPLHSADHRGMEGGFSAQLKAALQAAQHPAQEALLCSASRPSVSLVSASLTPKPALLGQPVADGLPFPCSATVLQRSAAVNQAAETLPPARQQPSASSKTVAKAGRNKKGGSLRAAAGRQEAPVLTNRGRVRQRGSKRAELIQVGKLRYCGGPLHGPAWRSLTLRCTCLLLPA
jgi:hypothetical protein